MRVDCFLLADHAAESGGKLFILGGGWDQLAPPLLPFEINEMALAIKLVVDWNETNQPIRITIALEDQDGKSLLPEPVGMELTVGRPPTISQGAQQGIAFAVTLNRITFHTPGTYRFVMRANDEQLAATSFEVHHPKVRS